MALFVKRGTLLVWFGSVVSGLAACSIEGDVLTPPRGPEDLAIAQVETVAERVSTSGESLTVHCGEPLLVRVSPQTDSGGLREFMLQPPGKCGSEPNCGWILVTADFSEAPDPMPIEVMSVRSTLRLDLPSEWRSGTLTLHVELRDSQNQPVLTDANKVLGSEFAVELTTVEDCASST